MTDFDPVSKPKHYNSHPSGLEVIEVTRHCTFDIGNAIKYLMRHNLKGNPEQDLRKALWYLNDHIAHDSDNELIPDQAYQNLLKMASYEKNEEIRIILMLIAAGGYISAAKELEILLENYK